MSTRAPRILIVSGNLALLRGHYEGVIARLVRGGADVRVRYLKESGLSLEDYRATLADAGIEIPVEPVPRKRRGGADLLALRLRELGNILRYTHPDYRGRDVLSARAFEKTGPSARWWARRILRLGPDRAARVARMLGRWEATLPPPRPAVELLEQERPDVVAVAPVVRVPSLVDFLKAGAAKGLGTAIWVQSWDNLTNKGLLHFVPDRVFVWNESQREELERYHGVGAEHVAITGAQTFDHWFEGREPAARAEFCAALGIDPDRPIILYLASSRGIAPDEPTFFRRWLTAVRSSGDEALESATILLRPHPTLASAWHSRRFEQEPRVVLSPATLKDALNSDPFREQYRGELRHATVACGINTSGMIDAAIFGKPVATVELPEIQHGQRGTVHFQHLADPEGGFLHTASSLDEHVTTLGRLVRRGPDEQDERSVAFTRRFVRPLGTDASPTEVFVEEMLGLCRSGSRLREPSQAEQTLGRVTAVSAAAVGGVVWNPRRLVRRRLKRLPKRAFRLARRVARRARHLVRRLGRLA